MSGEASVFLSISPDPVPVAPHGATAMFRSLSNTPSTFGHPPAHIRHNLTMLGLNTLRRDRG